MSGHYVAPLRELDAFNCPRCGAFAQQRWARLSTAAGYGAYEEVHEVTCTVCLRGCLWLGDRMVDPTDPTAAVAHDEMPADVASLYNEAREIAGRSPRAAAGLLRLALQMLLRGLEPEARDLNAAIGALVTRGLESRVTQAMDVLRVIGNNAVHPGELRLDEDPELVPALFELLNLVVEQVIARPGRVDALFQALPEGAREAIERRDASSRDAE